MPLSGSQRDSWAQKAQLEAARQAAEGNRDRERGPGPSRDHGARERSPAPDLLKMLLEIASTKICDRVVTKSKAL